MDLVAPTASHNVTNPNHEVEQNTDLNLNVHVAGGSSEQNFKIRAGFNDGSTDIWGKETSDIKFGQSLNDGIAGNKTEAAAVLVSCSVPVATDYVSKAQITSTTDLCGNKFASLPINSTAQGKDGVAGLFDVIANSEGECAAVTNQAVVTAPLPPTNLPGDPPSEAESSYALVQCLTSQNAGSVRKPKIVSYPGTVHLGTVLNSTGNGTCDETVAVGDIVFNLDADFDIYQTGASSPMHVFVGTPDDSVGLPAGDGPGFWYHTGYPLVEIDPTLFTYTILGDKQTLIAHLGSTNLGCGNGLLPKGETLYARAHAKPPCVRIVVASNFKKK